ncbi:peptidase MA family metallohydrolase [Chloroflexota bacterium]
MIKKIGILAATVSLLLVSLFPVPVQAQSGIIVSDSSAQASYPLRLSFNISAQSQTNITDIRLHYRIDRDGFAEVVSEAYLDFAPDTAVKVQWSLDMRRIGGLPPESVVDYWWTLTDASGDTVQTTSQGVVFDDTRFSWQSLTEGMVTIRWYRGDLSFARELMTTAQAALVRLAEDTGAYLKKPVKIYIYATYNDLQSAMIFPQEWTGGVAYTEYGIIAMGIAPDNLAWGKTSTVHELTHLVVHQMTFNPYNSLPTWLSEGLAMYNEGLLDPTSAGLLQQAATGNSLISVRTLASPFSSDTDQALLSYAQSYSLVEYLVTTYGQSRMLELMAAFSQGSTYDGALENVYGFDMDGLNILWQEYIIGKFKGVGNTAWNNDLAPAGLADWLLGGLLFEPALTRS